MNYSFSDNKVYLTDVDEFDIKNTFECGQCFRWNRINDSTYRGVVGSKIVDIEQKNTEIVLSGINKNDFENCFADYFDLKLNYAEVKKKLSEIDENLRLACEFSHGIRILHQEPWETLCSFIISQNNNIPRIKLIVENLCKMHGTKICDNFYAFPTVDVVANLSLADLAPLKCGFRDKYIIDAAQKIALKTVNLNKIKELPIEEARKELMKINGVGPKVAECTLLYGMHRLEAFPVDVWIKKAMSTLFKTYSPNDFGKYAGIAQQYIFHYFRTNSKNFVQG